jgi:enoyl-CoA hydratase/carnithine racemase
MAVRVEIDGRVAVVTIDRPEARNAIDPETSQALNDAFVRVESDDDVWVSVITGAGDVFCAGADLKAMAAGREQEMSDAKPYGFGGLVRPGRVKPVIGAANGHALAGGLELLLSCDLVVAAEGAQFGLPEVARGIIAGAGGVWRLAQQIPHRRAMELVLTADRLDAAEALQYGLVNRVVPRDEVLPTALALAGRICENAPLAVRESRQIAAAAPGLADEDGWRMVDDAWSRIWESEDAREGPRAFAEKRAPQWKGR